MEKRSLEFQVNSVQIPPAYSCMANILYYAFLHTVHMEAKNSL